MDYLMVLVANFSFKVIRIASRVALRGQELAYVLTIFSVQLYSCNGLILRCP